jgi:LuxR family maltose regulon positive regulatory protein
MSALHRRASEWLESNGLIHEAIDQSLAAGDTESAAGLIRKETEPALMRCEFVTVMSWIEALPETAVREDPLLSVYHAMTLLIGGSPIDRIEPLLERAGKAGSDTRVSAMMRVVRTFVALIQGDVKKARSLAENALADLPAESTFFRSFVLAQTALVAMLDGEIEGAVKFFEEVAQVSRKNHNLWLLVASLRRLAELAIAAGRLDQAKRHFERIMKVAVDGHGKSIPVAGIALIGLGDLKREWNDLAGAAESLLQGVGLAGKWGAVWSMGGYISLSRVYQAQGDNDKARQSMEKSKALALEYESTELDDYFVAAYQVRLWISQDNLERAWRWAQERNLIAEEGNVGGISSPYILGEIETITLARLFIAQKETDKALQALASLREKTESLGRTGSAIEILTLEALAYEVQGDSEVAREILAKALVLAEPGRYTRVFLDEGAPMAKMIYDVASQGILPQYTGRLLAAFPSFESRRRPSGETIEPLSEREREVLELISEGLSNKEVAGRMFISLRTVKWHTGNIYGKLGVNSRTQAVAKAKALGLLPAL